MRELVAHFLLWLVLWIAFFAMLADGGYFF
jgi:hypothetical protein